MTKNVETTMQLRLFHMLKIMIKIFQARLQQYVNWELPNVQAEFQKDRGTRDQSANVSWVMNKIREFQKKNQNAILDES